MKDFINKEILAKEDVSYKKGVTIKKVSPRKKKVVPGTVSIRIASSTGRTRTMVNQLNKKTMGRQVIVDDVLFKSLNLLKDEHLDEIKRSTYSGDDLLNLKHKEYCELHGHITKEKFLKILFEIELPSVGNEGIPGASAGVSANTATNVGINVCADTRQEISDPNEAERASCK